MAALRRNSSTGRSPAPPKAEHRVERFADAGEAARAAWGTPELNPR